MMGGANEGWVWVGKEIKEKKLGAKEGRDGLRRTRGGREGWVWKKRKGKAGTK